MLDFVEKSYFFEMERKTKLHTALAFPFSVTVVGITLAGYASRNWALTGLGYWALILPVLGIAAFFFRFAINVWRFSFGRTYRHIWTASAALEHKATLDEFSKAYPDTPAAQETFDRHLILDIAICATHNSQVNDQRSSNLYNANQASLLLSLISVFIAVIAAAFEVGKS